MKLISWFKSPVIEFFCDERHFGVVPPPMPAGKAIPDWYKKIPAHVPGQRDANLRPAMSAKKCMPMIDAMTLGFVIPLPMDLHVISNHDCTEITTGPTTTALDQAVERHDAAQVAYAWGKQDPLKFINPWVIKTAPGWSTLFVPPINAFDDRFICLGAMVDTDRYPKQVNFPARWLKPNFDGTLPAGTPLVTAIPIKRADVVKDFTVRQIETDEQQTIDRISRCQQSRANVYTNELREAR